MKDDWQKFLGDNFDHRPKEARLFLMRWTKDDLAFLMVLEQILLQWMKEVLDCWV